MLFMWLLYMTPALASALINHETHIKTQIQNHLAQMQITTLMGKNMDTSHIM